RHTRSKRDWSSDVCSSDLSAETSENCWNNASVAGTRPIVTTHCVRVPSRNVRLTRSQFDDAGFAANRPEPAKSNKPTAPNDSQRSEERRVGKERRSGRSPY